MRPAHSSCWINDKPALIGAFLAPLVSCILISAALVLAIVRAIYGPHSVHSEVSGLSKASLLKDLLAIIAVSVLLGLAWLFGALIDTGNSGSSPVFQYLFALFTVLFGAAILVLSRNAQTRMRTTKLSSVGVMPSHMDHTMTGSLPSGVPTPGPHLDKLFSTSKAVLLPETALVISEEYAGGITASMGPGDSLLPSILGGYGGSSWSQGELTSHAALESGTAVLGRGLENPTYGAGGTLENPYSADHIIGQAVGDGTYGTSGPSDDQYGSLLYGLGAAVNEKGTYLYCERQ